MRLIANTTNGTPAVYDDITSMIYSNGEIAFYRSSGIVNVIVKTMDSKEIPADDYNKMFENMLGNNVLDLRNTSYISTLKWYELDVAVNDTIKVASECFHADANIVIMENE